MRQNCGILYRCCSLHKIIYRPFKRHSLILYGKVVIGLKVILYLRKSQGGLGLVHILSRLHAFRLRFIHEYLYYDRHSCFRIANVFFRRVYDFGYSKQLFLLMPVKYDLSNIPPFYQSLINTWSLFSHKKMTPPCPVDGIPFEPL